MSSHGYRVVHVVGMGKYPPTISFHVAGGAERHYAHPTMASHRRLTQVINEKMVKEECQVFTYVSGWSAFETGALVSIS